MAGFIIDVMVLEGQKRLACRQLGCQRGGGGLQLWRWDLGG